MALSKNRIKYIHSLEIKKHRDANQVFVAEGPKLVGELLGHFPCQLLVATSDWMDQQHTPPVCDEFIEVSEEELVRASFLKSPQQVMAVFHQRKEAFPTDAAKHNLCLALDGVQDPGNLGTILRLADWFGIRHILCSPDTADVYNPKTVQATMGSLARVSVHYTDLQEFRLLNPSFNRPVVVAAHQGSILIPAAKADAFVSNLINWQATGKPLSNWSTHTVKKGETLKTIAKRYGMTEDEVRAANKIPKNRRVQVGSTILVKDAHASQDIQVAEADSAMRLVPLPTTRRITYRVRSGDTLSGIASRFGVKAADIRKQNRLKSNTIKVGQRLRLTVREVQRAGLRKTAYRVKRGDTLYTIAQRHRTSVSAIMDENRLQTKNLKPGQRLVIPH